MTRVNPTKAKKQQRAVSARNPNWLPLTFGKYAGRSIAPIFFQDPQYFDSLYVRIRNRQKSSEEKLLDHVSFVGWMTDYIMPPKDFDAVLVCYGLNGRSGSDKTEFRRLVAVDANDSNVERKLSKKHHNVVRQEMLWPNIIFAKCSSRREWDRVARELRLLCLKTEEPSDSDCEKFFEDEYNFDQDCWSETLTPTTR